MLRTSASSSTTRIVRATEGAEACAAITAVPCSSAGACGRKIDTVVPRPTSDAMVTVPPDCFAKPYTMLRPRPVPRLPLFVVKNGSNTRAITSAGMPDPVSCSASTAYVPCFGSSSVV